MSSHQVADSDDPTMEDRNEDTAAYDHLYVKFLCQQMGTIVKNVPLVKMSFRAIFIDIGVEIPLVNITRDAIVFFLMKSKEDKRKVLDYTAQSTKSFLEYSFRFFDVRLEYEYLDFCQTSAIDLALEHQYPLYQKPPEKRFEYKCDCIRRICRLAMEGLRNSAVNTSFDNPQQLPDLKCQFDDLIMHLDYDKDTNKIIPGRRMRHGLQKVKHRKFAFVPLDRCFFVPDSSRNVLLDFVNFLDSDFGRSLTLFDYKTNSGMICGLKFNSTSTSVILTILLPYPEVDEFIELDDLGSQPKTLCELATEAGVVTSDPSDCDKSDHIIPIERRDLDDYSLESTKHSVGKWSLANYQETCQEMFFFDFKRAYEQIRQVEDALLAFFRRGNCKELASIYVSWHHALRRPRDNGFERHSDVYYHICGKKSIFETVRLEKFNTVCNIEKIPHGLKWYPHISGWNYIISSLFEMGKLGPNSIVAVYSTYPEIIALLARSFKHCIVLDALSIPARKYLRSRCFKKQITLADANLNIVELAIAALGSPPIDALIVWPTLKTPLLSSVLSMNTKRLIQVDTGFMGFLVGKKSELNVPYRGVLTRVRRTCDPYYTLSKVKVVDCSPCGPEISTLCFYEKAEGITPNVDSFSLTDCTPRAIDTNPEDFGLPTSFVSKRELNQRESDPPIKKHKPEKFPGYTKPQQPQFSSQGKSAIKANRGSSMQRGRGNDSGRGSAPYQGRGQSTGDNYDQRSSYGNENRYSEPHKGEYAQMSDGYGSYSGKSRSGFDVARGPQSGFGPPREEYVQQPSRGPPAREEYRQHGPPPRRRSPPPEPVPDSKLLMEQIRELKETQMQLKQMLASTTAKGQAPTEGDSYPSRNYAAPPRVERYPESSYTSTPRAPPMRYEPDYPTRIPPAPLMREPEPAPVRRSVPTPPPPPIISHDVQPERKPREDQWESKPRASGYEEPYYKNVERSSYDAPSSAMEWWNKQTRVAGGTSQDPSRDYDRGNADDNYNPSRNYSRGDVDDNYKQAEGERAMTYRGQPPAIGYVEPAPKGLSSGGFENRREKVESAYNDVRSGRGDAHPQYYNNQSQVRGGSQYADYGDYYSANQDRPVKATPDPGIYGPPSAYGKYAGAGASGYREQPPSSKLISGPSGDSRYGTSRSDYNEGRSLGPSSDGRESGGASSYSGESKGYSDNRYNAVGYNY